MTWKRRFLGIGASALILLGISTNASATITGSGCVLTSTTVTTGQSAPLSAAAFTAGCGGMDAGLTVAGTFTFAPPDNININEGGGGVNTAAGVLGSNTPTPIACVGAGCTVANASAGAAGTTPNSSEWFEFQYTLGTAVSQSLTITHDDGIAVTVGGVLETPVAAAGPTAASPTTFTFSGTAGQVVDLFYDECCGLPAVLTANMPGEATPVVPEPASIVMLGTALVGISMFLKRRKHV
jgi:PEP-CTERM motif